MNTEAASAIVKELAPFVAQRALWTQDDVAIYLRCSERLVRSYIAKPDFPKAIRLYGSGHPRYKASEVCDWAESHMERT